MTDVQKELESILANKQALSLEDFQKIEALALKNGEDPNVLRIYGSLLARQKEYTKAIPVLAKARDLVGEAGLLTQIGIEITANLAGAYYAIGNFSNAKELALWLAKNNPLNPRNIELMTRACVAEGDLGSAGGLLQAMLQQLPKLGEQGNDERQAELAKRALAQARASLGQLMLYNGNWGTGFDLVRSRFDSGLLERFGNITVPEWDGTQSLMGAKILILPEREFADILLSLTYVPLLRDLGAKVSTIVPAEMHMLISTLGVLDEVVISGQGFATPTYVIYGLNLPGVFKTTGQNRPEYRLQTELTTGFLEERGYKSEHFRPRIGILTKPPVSSPEDEKNALPELQAKRLVSDLKDDFNLILLDQDRKLEGAVSLQDYASDLLDLARLLNDLDMVIAVESNIAHISAFIGKPTIVISQKLMNWRWLFARERVWYPDAEVCPQLERGSWEAPVARAVKIVRERFPK